MAKQTRYLRVEIVDDSLQLTLRDLCQDCGVHAEAVIKMVEHGVLEPQGVDSGNWRFVGRDLIRIKRAIRLQQDLAINLAGVALTLDLLDEIATLRRRLHQLGPANAQPPSDT